MDILLNLRISILLIGIVASYLSAAEPWPCHVIDNTSRGADGVRLADVNSDGRLDIATGWEEGGCVRVYVNPGPKESTRPWPHVSVGHVDAPEDALLVDLDQDGATDVVSCCEGRIKTVYVHWAPRQPKRFLQTEAWITNAIPATQKKQAWMFALPMDMDGQYGIDIVVGSKGRGGAVGWLQAPRDARQLDQWRYHRLCDAGWIMSLQPHDMDGDGNLDLLISDRKGPSRGVFWLKNPNPEKNRSAAIWERQSIGGDDREVMFLTRARLDPATSPFVLAAVRNQGISAFRDSGRMTWDALEIPLPENCGTGKGVAVGDINLDGQADIVFTCENASGRRSGVRWLSGTIATSWKDHEISGEKGVKFDRIELLDLDADGDLDVLTCEERANLGVIWYENPTRESNASLSGITSGHAGRESIQPVAVCLP